MKRALVLCGGGSLGAYEAGAIDKMVEKGMSFQIVTGTSIGSLNGFYVATHQEKEITPLWSRIGVEDLIKGGFNLNQADLKAAVKERALANIAATYHHGVDISPYVSLLKRIVDPSLIVGRKDCLLGVVYTKRKGMKEMRQLLNDASPDMVIDYLLASSACYPIFPAHKINGVEMIDGGWTNNLPIDYALSLGADEVWAVLLHSWPKNPQKPEYRKLPSVHVIEQSRELGTILDFDREALEEARKIGYLDAGRELGDYVGFRYAFQRTPALTERAHAFYLPLAQEPKRYEALRAHVPYHHAKANGEVELYVRVLEHLGHRYGMDPTEVYDPEEFRKKVRELSLSFTPTKGKEEHPVQKYLRLYFSGKKPKPMGVGKEYMPLYAQCLAD